MSSNLRDKEIDEVIIGLLEIAYHVLPDTFWQTDSRVEAARVLLGKAFPSNEVLLDRFVDRVVPETVQQRIERATGKTTPRNDGTDEPYLRDA